MIHTSLSRAGLVLAVIASLAVRAYAFGEIPPAFAVPAAAKTKPQKPAAPTPPKAPTAPDAVWRKVVEAVRVDGKYHPEAGQEPGAFTLEDETGDPKADHTKHMITFLGLLNEDEKFEAMGAMLIVMKFKLDPKDGNWRIDQWVFETDIYGQVTEAGHGTLIQTPDGKTVSATPDKLNPADPKIQTQYNALLKHWAERKP